MPEAGKPLASSPRSISLRSSVSLSEPIMSKAGQLHFLIALSKGSLPNHMVPWQTIAYPPPPARVGITTPPPTAARPFIFIGCWYFVIENPGGDKSVSLETCGWAGHSPFTCISPVTPIYHNTVPWPQNTVTAQTMLNSTQHWEDHSWSGPIFYLWLSKVLANERRRYLCNVFSHWLRPCSAIDRKQNM